MKKIVKISAFFPAFISSRKSIKLLKDNVSFSIKREYVIDFEGINFISRSFADELLKFLDSKKIYFEFKNANSDIIKMFDVVKKTQNPTDRHFSAIPVTRFKQGVQLDGLLSTL